MPRCLGALLRTFVSVLLCVATLAEEGLAEEKVTATASAVAELTVAVPLSDSTVSQRFVMELAVKALKAPSDGKNMGVVVSIKRPSDGKSVEVGRVSFYPLTSFPAQKKVDEMMYQFDVTKPLSELKPDGLATVEVKIVDRLHGGSVSEGTVTLGNVKIIPR